jgi:hypothetical protein
LIIGHGSATLGLFGRVTMLILSALFAWFAFARDTRLGAPFSHGKGPSVPIGSAGRVITILIAIVLLVIGLGVLK